MKPIYALNCSVCNNSYYTRSTWLNHLIQPNPHQNRARKKCVKRWFGKKLEQDELDSFVIIFSSFSLNQLTTLESMLERLSEINSLAFSCWVTDFVWWPERDTVGYLQFESREVVTELFRILDGPNFQVENKPVQLKRAVDIPKLEINALLPREIANEIFLQEDTVPTAIVTTAPTTTTLAPSSIKSHPLPKIPSSSVIPKPRTPLQLQFNSICKSTEIPESQLNEALKITKILEQLLSKQQPCTKVFPFRNFYLRLKNNGANNLIIYAYTPDNSPSNPNGFTSIDRTVEELIIQSPQFQQNLSNYSRLHPHLNKDGGKGFLNETTKFQFTLIFYPLHIVEAHLSLLIQYLCTFDVHVKPILTLVHFWARANRVKIAEWGVPFKRQNSICEEPSALEWMVILFLAREGVVPRVREIVEREHVIMTVGEHQDDFGFSMDPEYPKEWRRKKGLPVAVEDVDVTSDQFVLEVVRLTQRFFEFFGVNLEEGCWVLNPKDGEILKREGGRIGKSGGLSKEEMKRLIFAQNDKAVRNNMDMTSLRIFVLNPLHITWRLSFDVERWMEVTCEKMRETGKRLGEFLNGEKKLSLESALKVN